MMDPPASKPEIIGPESKEGVASAQALVQPYPNPPSHWRNSIVDEPYSSHRADISRKINECDSVTIEGAT